MTTWDIESSPYFDYIGSNTIPSDSEIDAIQTLLFRPRKELAQLDDQIEAIQSSLSVLLKKRQHIAKFIDKHLPTVSLVRRLPEDVLSEIFVACLSTSAPITFSAKEAPSILAWVCQRWRKVALGTPELWSNVHVAFPSRPAESVGRFFDLRSSAFWEWMARAKDHLLSLSFSEGYRDREASSILAPLILPLTSRIQKLHIVGREVDLLQLSRSQFPVLQKLSVGLNHTGMPHELASSVFTDPSSILQADGLKDVTVSGISGPPKMLPLKWYQLTRLSLYIPFGNPTFTEGTFLDILESCPLLQYFEVDTTGTSKGHDVPATHPWRIVTSSVLESLHILSGTCLSPSVFQMLRLPALKELFLAFTEEVRIPDEARIKDSVRKLTIDTGHYLSSYLVDFLSGFRNLEHLAIMSRGKQFGGFGSDLPLPQGHGFTDEILQAMTPMSQSEKQTSRSDSAPNSEKPKVLFPLLQSLAVPNQRATFSTETLLSFVAGKNGGRTHASSSPSVSKLRRLKLCAPDVPHPNIRSALAEYVEDGLQLDFYRQSIYLRPISHLRTGAYPFPIWEPEVYEGIGHL